ncbi:MAG: ASKHA domain-containing protein, partial [Candidatus Sifarchaeia archaeon]
MSDPQNRELQSCGISVDVGTSQITVHVLRLPAREVASEIIVPNPQNRIGFDVISRVAYSSRSVANARELTKMVRRAVSDAFLEALEVSGLPASSVNEVVIVGNTVMHHLFHGLPVESLAEAPYTPSQTNSVSTTAGAVGLELEKETPVYSPPIVQSFIGPDALMMLVTSEAFDAQDRMVAIDVGTNTEIAVCHDGQIWLASAASGPAFEGMSLQCGMPATEGAIESVRIGPDYKPDITVVSGGRPRGICGSGAISTVAAVLDAGLLDSKGSLKRNTRSAWVKKEGSLFYYVVVPASQSATANPIYVSQVDLRMLQQS